MLSLLNSFLCHTQPRQQAKKVESYVQCNGFDLYKKVLRKASFSKKAKDASFFPDLQLKN